MVFKIIPIGTHCGISFALRRLKLCAETGVFEWYHSNSIKNITNIIRLIAKDIKSVKLYNDTTSHRCISMHDPNIYTAHYTLEKAIEAFERRASRFLEDIKSGKDEILFIREMVWMEHTNIYEFNDFCNAIREINPKLQFKVLLISIIRNPFKFHEIKAPNLIHTYIRKNRIRDTYWKDKSDLSPWIEIISLLRNAHKMKFIYDTQPLIPAVAH